MLDACGYLHTYSMYHVYEYVRGSMQEGDAQGSAPSNVKSKATCVTQSKASASLSLQSLHNDKLPSNCQADIKQSLSLQPQQRGYHHVCLCRWHRTTQGDAPQQSEHLCPTTPQAVPTGCTSTSLQGPLQVEQGCVATRKFV